MGKNKLRKFAEMETFHNVFQCGAREILPDSPVAAMAGHWRERYFHNENPIVLELGCGRGNILWGWRNYIQTRTLSVLTSKARVCGQVPNWQSRQV